LKAPPDAADSQRSDAGIGERCAIQAKAGVFVEVSPFPQNRPNMQVELFHRE
jgi:hypothetical protein